MGGCGIIGIQAHSLGDKGEHFNVAPLWNPPFTSNDKKKSNTVVSLLSVKEHRVRKCK